MTQKGYTSKDVALMIADVADSAPVTRQAVSLLAKRKEWRVIGKSGKQFVYHADDVEQYIRARRRTKMLITEHWWRPRFGGHLNQESQLDYVCPICGAYAVRNPMLPYQWACTAGHRKGEPW